MRQCENLYMDRHSRAIACRGAKGIEGEDFAVEVGADKIVFAEIGQRGEALHLYAGPQSGTMVSTVRTDRAVMGSIARSSP